MEQRIKVGKLQPSTQERYNVTLREFEEFLSVQKIGLLQDINKPLVESFKVWRIERIRKQKNSRGATGLVFGRCDPASGVRVRGRKRDDPKESRPHGRKTWREPRTRRRTVHGAWSVTIAGSRRGRASDFLLLRWTGLRGSDAVSVTWREVHFDRKEIERVTQKRKKRVILPVQTELMFALEAEFARRKPEPSDRVLTNPLTGKPLTRPRLYQRMLALGKRAGVPDAHPHRFRDTLAVDMLTRGASPYDVAKMLGDTIETVEKHYTPFVRELRERVRMILETGTGLENLSKTQAIDPQNEAKKPN
jgi:integrase